MNKGVCCGRRILMTHTAKQLCALGLCTFGFLFSANAQEAKPRFPMPKAKYNVRIEKSVMIPMRDGVKLSTDLYFPEGAGEKLPVILVCTPYNKNTQWSEEEGSPFAGQATLSLSKTFAGSLSPRVITSCRLQTQRTATTRLTGSLPNPGRQGR